MLIGIKNIIGKWNGNRYRLIQKIAEGGIGEVYKAVDSKGNIRAIKISLDVSSITREFNIMRELRDVDGVPRVFELDDYCQQKRGTTFYFFVMELIDGDNLKEIAKKKKLKVSDIIGIGLILTNFLKRIQDRGYTYTDIKLENILIDNKNHRVLFVDFGGINNREWGIREYTPTYNLISWGIREKYNYIESTVFGVTMVMISLLLRREFNPLLEKPSDITRQIREMDIDYEFKKALIRGIKVKFQTLETFSSELNKLIIKVKRKEINTVKGLDIINAFFIVSLGVFLLVMLYVLKIIII